MSIRIEYLRPKHLESLHRAIDVVAKERKYFIMVQAPQPSDLHKLADTQMKGNLPFYVARDNARVVGWINIMTDANPGRKHVGDLSLGIVSAHRGKGIGSKLLKKALQHGFDKSRLIRIQLEVYTDNTPAIQLYCRHGFQLEGIRRKAIRIRGKYKDVVMMAIVP